MERKLLAGGRLPAIIAATAIAGALVLLFACSHDEMSKESAAAPAAQVALGSAVGSAPPPSHEALMGSASAPAASPTPAADVANFPKFPWPPPQASAAEEVDRALLVKPKTPSSLQDVSQRLAKAFEAAGYGDKSYYAVPDGFAMVSRLEQIKDDGSPEAGDRWSLRVKPYLKFSLAAYMKALFTVEAGHYRIICFVVSPHPFSETDQTVSDATAIGWVSHGANFLPKEAGAGAYTPDYHCTALIYEFAKISGTKPALTIPPQSLSADAHLQGSGLLKALQELPQP
jgi:hypothetical protein